MTAKLWDVATGQLRVTLRGQPFHAVRSLAFSPDGKTLATAGLDETVGLWDIATAQLRASLKVGTGILSSVAFSPDGRLLAVASHQGRFKEPTKGQPVVQLWVRTVKAGDTKHEATTGAAPPGGGREDRLEQLLRQLLQSDKTDDQIIDALVLASLARFPTEVERTFVTDALASQKDRAKVFGDFLSLLTNSKEFSADLDARAKRAPRTLKK
jgi:hypothetical protein